MFQDIDNILKVPVASLSESMNEGSTIAELDVDLSRDETFRHYSEFDWNPVTETFFRIGQEILSCESEGSRLNCEDSAETNYDAGEPVYFLPFAEGAFWLSTSVIPESARSFAELANDVGVSFIYFDGYSYVPEPEMDGATELAFQFSRGILPYLEALDVAPTIQTGTGNVGSFGWYFQNRTALGDGASFRVTEFTRDWKVEKARRSNPYADTVPELGWWRIVGSMISTGAFDADAVSPDDVHYVASRALGLETAVGVQFGLAWTNHWGLEELFDVFGTYNGFVEAGHELPAGVQERLRAPDGEVRFSQVGEAFHVVKTQRTRHSVVWDSEEDALVSFDNPFGAQKLQLEVRPRPDYRDLSDESADHIRLVRLLADEPDVEVSSDEVTCSYDLAQARMIMENRGADVGGCKLNFPNPMETGAQRHRGVGVKLLGSGGEAVLIVHLESKSYAGYRDFRADLDLDSGYQEIVLGDPTTAVVDPVGGVVDSANSTWGRRNWRAWRSRDFRWDEVQTELILFVPAGATVDLQILGLHALQERGNDTLEDPTDDNLLRAPVVVLNGAVVAFPSLELATGANEYGEPGYMLRYGGDTSYRVFTDNFREVPVTTSINGDATVVHGDNTLWFSADVGETLTRRAELIITVVNDEDDDGVPSDGDFSPGGEPCDGTNSFCDDNCPNVPNPGQEDSNGDGVGDAC